MLWLDSGAKANTFVSITQTFFTKENALAFVAEQNELYSNDTWENVEMHIDYNGHVHPVYRVQLIYRKRQMEMDV